MLLNIKSTIKSQGNSLIFECETDSLKAVISGLKETIRITKEKEVKEVPVCHLDHKTKFDGFTFWWFWITACAIAIKFVVNKIQSKI